MKSRVVIIDEQGAPSVTQMDTVGQGLPGESRRDIGINHHHTVTG